MQPGLNAVVIADDLTGAADTGVQLASVRSPLYLMPVESMVLDRPWMASVGGLSLYTASRRLSAAAAAERLRPVARMLADLRPRWVYKKVDSCLRGNLGAETDVLIDAFGLDAALVAPALPAQGRATVGGIHLVQGRPLAETEFAEDPLTPVTRSAVADILASQSRYPVGRIDVKEYDDSQRLQQALERELGRGCRLIACDAAEQEHLDQLARLVAQGANRLLPVGSAGLAAALVRQLSTAAVVQPRLALGLKRILLACGTGSQATRGQLDALLEKYGGVRRVLEPEWLVEASAEDRRRCAADLLDAWTGGVLALAIGPFPSEGPIVTPERAIAGLAGLASEVIRKDGVDGLFLSGGETADAVLRACGGEAIRLEQEVLPGLMLGRWMGGVADGLAVVTKAGAFGQEQTLVALYERMSRR
jgi:uncharacterized protein YgbK (DUF1537 family)